MIMDRCARQVAELLGLAGITVNGPRPWDPRVHDTRFFERVLALGNLGAGEAYMDGWWDVDALDEFFARLERAELHKRFGNRVVTSLAVRGQPLGVGEPLAEAEIDVLAAVEAPEEQPIDRGP